MDHVPATMSVGIMIIRLTCAVPSAMVAARATKTTILPNTLVAIAVDSLECLKV